MKGQFNKPICAIMISVVMFLGTIAIAIPYQEASAGFVFDFFGVHVDVLDKNGQLVDDSECALGSGITTVTIFMKGKTSLEFTVSGTGQGLLDKPGKAQQLIASFDEDTGAIESMGWFDVKERLVETLTIPPDANEFHVIAKKIVAVEGNCYESLDVSGKSVTTVDVRSLPLV